MVLVSFWAFNYTLFQIMLQPVPILWTSTSYTLFLDITIFRFWQLLFPSMFFAPRTHWNIPVLIVLSAKPNRGLYILNANPSTEQGGRININISSVQALSYGGANFCLFIQDDFTGYLWSYFIKAKSDLPASMFDWLQLVKKEISLN
jgi:hypothetical protein